MDRRPWRAQDSLPWYEGLFHAMTSLNVIVLILLQSYATAFLPGFGRPHRSRWAAATTKFCRRTASFSLSALTNRQLQFWEDVEDGLDDIANFWEKNGQSIDRIRIFGRR